MLFIILLLYSILFSKKVICKKIIDLRFQAENIKYFKT